MAGFHVITKAVTADYENPKPLILTQSDSRAIYSAPLYAGEPGYLLFIRAGDLLAQKFEAGRLRLSGDPIPVAQNVAYFGPNLGASISVSGCWRIKWFPECRVEVVRPGRKPAGVVGQPLSLLGERTVVA